MKPDVRESCDALRPPELPTDTIALPKETLAMLTRRIRDLERELADQRDRYRKLDREHEQRIRRVAADWADRVGLHRDAERATWIRRICRERLW